MQYLDLYNELKLLFYKEGNRCEDAGLNIEISHHSFVSDGARILSGGANLCCPVHGLDFSDLMNEHTNSESVFEISDADIESNRSFQYHMINVPKQQPAKGVIVFFHGLNEKHWDKYLPWAYGLAQETGKAVLLFPIAFHMDRAPELWSNRSEMQKVALKRQKDFIDNSESSFVNAAISTRLEAYPPRLFWSGLQTYSDITDLIDMIRDGSLEKIDPHASVDLFGYSIGAFLSVILMMSNPKGHFTNSKFFSFCGGSTIDRIFPISKYIMDGRSAIAMQECFASLLSSNFISDRRLAHYQEEEAHFEESWFKTMLRYDYFQKRREERLKELCGRIKALCLKQDEVVSPVETLNTLKGGYRDIPIEVEITDYPFRYSHMMPFPLTRKNADIVTASYREFILSASLFFGKK